MPTSKFSVLLPLAISFTLAAGCATARGPGAPLPEPGVDEGALSAADRRAVERARRALGEEGIAIAGLRLDSLEPRDWPDSSLGCQQPGMVYLQVITPGHQVRFAGPAQSYDVRVAGENAFICRPALQLRPGAAKEPPQSVRNLDLRVEDARAALTARLGVPASRVFTRNIVPVRLPAGPLGCELLASGGADAGRAGFQLVFSAGGEIHTFHTDLESVTPCPPVADE